jgi:hypothetical protein
VRGDVASQSIEDGLPSLDGGARPDAAIKVAAEE